MKNVDKVGALHTMRAVTVPRYGGPEVLEIGEIPRPAPRPGEVLVRVAWGAVNAADWRLMRADPWAVRLAFGLRRPRFAALGIAISGIVAESNDGAFQPGDRVAGDLSGSGCGGFAEYVSVPSSVLVRVPEGLALDRAATVPLAATTALQAIRDHGGLRAGGRMMVTGASGAVGLAAIEIGRNLGAEVWAVTSAAGRAAVEAVNPAHIVERDTTDATTDPRIPRSAFDVIIDTAGYRSIFDYRPLLAPQGVYVHVGGAMRRLAQTAVAGALRSRRDGQRWKTFTATADPGDLATLLEVAAAERLYPPIAMRVPLEAAADLIRAAEDHRVPGRALIGISSID